MLVDNDYANLLEQVPRELNHVERELLQNLTGSHTDPLRASA